MTPEGAIAGPLAPKFRRRRSTRERCKGEMSLRTDIVGSLVGSQECDGGADVLKHVDLAAKPLLRLLCVATDSEHAHIGVDADFPGAFLGRLAAVGHEEDHLVAAGIRNVRFIEKGRRLQESALHVRLLLVARLSQLLADDEVEAVDPGLVALVLSGALAEPLAEDRTNAQARQGLEGIGADLGKGQFAAAMLEHGDQFFEMIDREFGQGVFVGAAALVVEHGGVQRF